MKTLFSKVGDNYHTYFAKKNRLFFTINNILFSKNYEWGWIAAYISPLPTNVNNEW